MPSSPSTCGLERSERPGLPEYLTAAQVAELVGCDVATVYRWASNYVDMPVLRVGGIVRFHRERLAAWLLAREQGQPRSRRRASDHQSGGRAA